MPTKFRVRERLRIRLGKSSSPIPTSQTPPPPTASQIPASNSNSTVNNPPPPSTPPPPPSSQPVPTENLAFVQALQKHIQDLSPEDRQAFGNSSTISPDTLLASVKNYDDIHNNSSYSRKCISRIEGFLTAVDGYLKPLSVMIGQHQDISSLVVGGAQLIVQLGLKFANFFNKLTEMMDNLSSHLNYLSRYAKCFEHSKDVQEALSAAYGDLLTFFTSARRVFVDSKGNYSRWVSFRVFLTITWEPFEENFNTLLSGFQNHVDIVIRTASVDEYERLRSERLLDNEEKEDENRSKLLLWLSQLDFDEDHNRIFKKRHQNTGNWLVDSPEFKQWDNSKDSSLLWCYGNPGVGKSVLASLVLETISTKYSLDSQTGIAFVYFNFQDQETQKSIRIISTMIKQLARQKKNLPGDLKHFYKTYHRDAKFPTEEKIEAQFLDISKTFSQVFLIMDAMDEFESRKEFLSMISRFTQDPSVICKIFVTSRREVDIEDAFNRCGFSIIEIEVKKVDADIATYVRDEVDRRTKEMRRIIIDKELQAKITNTLTSKSEGMFLWVKYQLDFIYDQPSARHISKALGTLPADMNATYAQILRKINKQVPAKREIAQSVLMWVLCAKRPLTLNEMSIAVSLQPESEEHDDLEIYDAESLLETCCNLITFENGIFRPFHYTVQEFLASTKPDLVDSVDLALFQRYQVTVNDHARLAETCLRYFLLSDVASAQPRILHPFKTLYPFSVYAAAYWHHHVRDLAELPKSLAQVIDTFFDDFHGNCLLWAYRTAGDAFRGAESIDPLGYCLSLDILHLFQRSHQFDISTTDIKKYEDALHHAAYGGSKSNIKSLLDMGFPVNCLDNTKKTPLYFAALAGHKEASILLIENGANVNSQCGGDFGNALNAAASNDYAGVVGLLLDRGADMNARGKYGNALNTAAFSGSAEVVGLLLDRGADVNAEGGYFGSALQSAASSEKGLEIVRVLLDRGADVNAQGGSYGNALQAAANNKKGLEIVRVLLDRGADVNVQGGLFGNALQAAAGNENGLEMTRIFLDRGADVNTKGGCHGNALQSAANNKKGLEIVRVLLDRGADVNAQGGYYKGALQAAAKNEKGLEIVRVLLDRGADVNAKGGVTGNALQAAAYNTNLEMVRILLDRGADVNAQGGQYGNALQAAAYNTENPEIIKFLLDQGADVNSQGGYYGSALQAAAYNNKKGLEIVQILLDRGADINAQGGNYGNALQAAASNEVGLEIVQILLDRGADINAQGGSYGNALQAAAENKTSMEIVRLLLDRGADISAEGGSYGNVLQAAAFNEKGLEVVRILLDRGADVNAQGGGYGNALQAAAYNTNLEMVQILLDRGADIHAQGGFYGNALQAAANNERGLEIVQILLDRGADVNTQGGYFGNALQAAASNEKGLEIVRVLLDRGVDVNAQGGCYGNALQAAACNVKGFEIARILLDLGADVNAQGGVFQNALRAAKESCHTSHYGLLLEAGAREA